MASHQLAIAKASFSAGLLRPDPTSVSRDAIAHFHTLLSSAITQCTPRNIQNCKHWILSNITSSTPRCTALGKYLVALATSFGDQKTAGGLAKEPSVKRKRLHLLYLVNDVLHHAKYREQDASVCGKLQPALMGLVGSAASFKECPKHHRKIFDLLDIWAEKAYYSGDYIDKLREAAKNASEQGTYSEGATEEKEAVKSKSAPYVMPAIHGDSSTPWFDLPAGNLMPHIVPNSTRPINPDMIKPLQFVAGPADESLVLAVKGLLDDVDKIYGGALSQEEKATWDIDELGQRIILDEVTGDVLEGEGYYGWSRSFCEKMKRRRSGKDAPDRGKRDDSRSLSRSPKRRRYSSSEYSSPDRRRSPDRRSGTRSPTPRRDSRSRSPDRGNWGARPPAPPDAFVPPPPPPPNFIPPMPFPNGFNPQLPPPPPPPMHGMPPNGTNHQQYGSWVPPPPPMPGFNPQQWPPPPPTGPPPFPYPSNPGLSGPGGWQPPVPPNGRGQHHNQWNASHGSGGRGQYRGRGGGW